MTKKLCLIAISLCVSLTTAFASVAVPSVEDHLSSSQDIVMGSFEIDHRGNIYFVVEKTLKGDVVVLSKILINEDSKLAWEFLLGGKIVKPQEKEFNSIIQRKEWFSGNVIILGEFENGHWTSSYYDWSVWPQGEIQFRGQSVNNVEKFISEQLNDE